MFIVKTMTRAFLLVMVALLGVTAIDSPREAEAFAVIRPPGGAIGTPSIWGVVPAGGGAVAINIGINTAAGTGFPAACVPEITAAIVTWAARAPVVGGNLTGGPNPGPVATLCGSSGAGLFDLESIALHEIGHALGLNHPNRGARTGADRSSDDLRLPANDIDLVNPFDAAELCPALPDGPPLALPASFATAHRDNAVGFGQPANSEAVMIQGTVRGERQRSLLNDDMQGIYWIERGRDLACGGGDDFVYAPVNALKAAAPAGVCGNAPPVVPAGNQILISNCNLAAIGAGRTYNRPGFGGGVKIQLDQEADGTILGKTDVYYDSFGEIAYVDITLDIEAMDNSVGGIAELAEAAGTPLETDGSSGASAGVLAGIAGAVLVGGVTLGGAAWYARRRLIER